MKPILKIFVLSLIGLSGLRFSYSQYTISSTKEAEIYTQIPQEKVYLNHTGNILFSGEYLYYSFYCINTQTSKLSYFSEIGYVALINEDREYVLEQKLPLKNGLGQGEIFVTTEIPSGNYKLLAYTQWMKNNGLAQVFKTDLVIVNPYKNDQSQILGNSDQSFPTSPIQTKDLETKSSTFLIKLEKKSFGPREKVVAEIINYQGRLGHGNYSISVQKIDELSHISPMNPVDFTEQYADVLKSSIKSVGESIFLPEQDGELIYGKAFSNDPSQPFKNGTIVLSFPGNDFSLKYAKTDERGVFSTYLQENLRDSEIVIQALGEPGVNIQILDQPQLKLDNISFSNWRLNTDYLPEIQKRSIYNQIENQFYASKPDSVVVRSYTNIMLGGIPTVIKLDDYTRFPTLKETILENVLQAGIRRNESGQEYIRILQQSERPNDAYNSFPALVLIDGVFIPNHQMITNYNAYKIEEIKIVNEQYQLGDKIYQGIMAIKTFDGDFYSEYESEYGIKTSKPIPLPRKNYFQQKYSTNKTDLHIPDYRRILYWEPQMEILGNSKKLEFYTSDIAGHYLISLNGFTSYGMPISVISGFEVVTNNP